MGLFSIFGFISPIYCKNCPDSVARIQLDDDWFDWLAGTYSQITLLFPTPNLTKASANMPTAIKTCNQNGNKSIREQNSIRIGHCDHISTMRERPTE